jgi:hypothetical protein
MIIGISGRINSGKDTVGKIIKLIRLLNRADTKELLIEYEHFERNNLWDVVKGPGSFEIKKFADKLKDMACVLLGCTREQLEDREFKEKELGEEWRKYFNDSYDLVAKENSTFSEVLTPRKLLQLLGTECGRKIIHPNLWVNSLMMECKPIKEFSTVYPNWIITDVRFPNELGAIKDRGGITIRVNRPDLPEFTHLSEVSLNSAQFDYTIDNNGTIEELIEKIKNLKIWEDIMTEI